MRPLLTWVQVSQKKKKLDLSCRVQSNKSTCAVTDSLSVFVVVCVCVCRNMASPLKATSSQCRDRPMAGNVPQC